MKRLLFAAVCLVLLVLCVAAIQDILSESFEGTGYDMGAGWWTSVSAGVDPDSTEHLFTGGGSQSCKFVRTPADGAAISRLHPTPVAWAYLEFRFYIESESLSTGNFVVLGSDFDDTWAVRYYSYFQKEAGGGLTFQLVSYYDGSNKSATAQNISTGVEYRVRVKYDTTNNVVGAWLDDTSILSATPTAMLGGSKYLYFGSFTPEYTSTHYIDCINVSSTEFPDPEPAPATTGLNPAKQLLFFWDR